MVYGTMVQAIFFEFCVYQLFAPSPALVRVQFSRADNVFWASLRVPGVLGGVGVCYRASLQRKAAFVGKSTDLPCLVRVEGCRVCDEGCQIRVRRGHISGRRSLQLLGTCKTRTRKHPSFSAVGTRFVGRWLLRADGCESSCARESHLLRRASGRLAAPASST